jgi:hypothetical protein
VLTFPNLGKRNKSKGYGKIKYYLMILEVAILDVIPDKTANLRLVSKGTGDHIFYEWLADISYNSVWKFQTAIFYSSVGSM